MRGNGGTIFASLATSRPSVASSLRAILHHRLHDRADEPFAELDHVFEVSVGRLRLEHPEFSQVAPRLGFFGAERGTERIDLAERRGGGFHVQLPGLRQIGFLVVDVVHFEKRGGAFAGCRREDRRVGERVALRVHVIRARREWPPRECAESKPGAACESRGGAGRAGNPRRVP